MANEKETFLIDLDTKAAIEKALGLQSAIKGIGNEDNLTGLISGLTKVGAAVGLVGGALFAWKKAFDFAQEGEALLGIEKQFDILTAKTGIATETLREGLLKSARGLIDETTLLQQANKAMALLGDSAARLPELLSVAEKAGVILGTSTKETFENVVQAIAVGNSRFLKRFGVDAEVAIKKYADSIGTIPAALTEAAKKQALLNATIEAGGKAFGSVDTGGKAVTNSVAKLGIAFKDLGEAFDKFVAKTIGPWLAKAADQFSAFAKSTKNLFVGAFGEGTEKARANIALLDEQIERAKKTLEKPSQDGKSWWNRTYGASAGDRDQITKDLEGLMSKRKALESELTKGLEEEQKKRSKIAAEPKDQIDPAAARKEQSEFAKTLNEFRDKELQARLANTLSVEEIESAQKERLLQLEQNLATQKEQILANEQLTREHRLELVSQLETTFAEQKLSLSRAIAIELENVEIASLERRSKATDSAWNKFSIGAQLASAKSRKSLNDFTTFGQTSVQTMADAFGVAFQQVGAGGISLGDALKKSMIGAVADIAAAKGKELIASSIFPPNPLGIAAGAGLLALSGVLRSSVGASASVPSGGETAGGGGRSPTPIVSPQAEVPEPEQFAAQSRKSVTIQVMGSYFETEETRTKLVELIRQSSDATDFKILSVGGKV